MGTTDHTNGFMHSMFCSPTNVSETVKNRIRKVTLQKHRGLRPPRIHVSTNCLCAVVSAPRRARGLQPQHITSQRSVDRCVIEFVFHVCVVFFLLSSSLFSLLFKEKSCLLARQTTV